MGKTCCFTGHRPASLPFGYNENDPRCLKLKQALAKAIETQITENGVTHFISGMALGVDTYAAEIVLHLKETAYPFLTLECAIPCRSQAEKWPAAPRRRYAAILRRATVRTLLQEPYTADCMMKRNRYMVDHSDVLIAVWNGAGSGTGNTVRYAQSRGKAVVFLNPDDLV